MREYFSSKIYSSLFFLIMHIYIWSVVTTTMQIHSALKYSREDFVKIVISTPTSEKHRVKRSGPAIQTVPVGSNLLPHELNISFNLAGFYHNFVLKKNHKLDNAPIPIQTTFSDETVHLHGLSSIKHVGAYYQNDNGTANFHLECTSNTSSTCTLYRLFGTFEHDADLHLIEPTIQPVDLGGEHPCEIHRIVEALPNKGFMFDHLVPALNETVPERTTGKGPGIKGPGMKGLKPRRPTKPRKRPSSSPTRHRRPALRKKLHTKTPKVQLKKKQRKGRKHRPRTRAKKHRKHHAHKTTKLHKKTKKPDKKKTARQIPIIPAAIVPYIPKSDVPKTPTILKIPRTLQMHTTDAPKTSPIPKIPRTLQMLSTDAPKTSPIPKIPRTLQMHITDAPKISTTDVPKISTTDVPKISTTDVPKIFTTDVQKMPKRDTTVAPKILTTGLSKIFTTKARTFPKADIPDTPQVRFQHVLDISSTMEMPTQPMEIDKNGHHPNGKSNNMKSFIPGFFHLPNLTKTNKSSNNSSKSTSHSLGHEDVLTPNTIVKSKTNFFYPSFKMKGIRHYGSFDNVPVSSGGEKKPQQSDTFNGNKLEVHHFAGGRKRFDKYLDNVIGTHHSRKKRATGTYLVEVYTIIDFEIYSFWLKEANNDPEQALQRIRQYYVFLINGVDGRYRQLGASYKIEITLVGIYIAKTKRDLTYLDDNTSCRGGGPCILNANKAVADVRTWFQRKGLPQHDHVMTFTRHDMRTGSFDTAGSAFLNSICTSRSHSIVEEKFDFIAATVAAHEIGHALGAVHDGDNNPCSRTPRYIMVSISSAMKKPYRKSPWQFSSCTKREIGLYLDTLNRNKTSHCMRSKYQGAQGFGSAAQKKLGQTFNVDKQCEFIAGKGSFACRSLIGNGNYEGVCTGLWCKDMSRSDANCLLALPAEGTTCGRGKLCHGYACVSDSNAPTDRPSNCLYGDSPGRVLKGLTCKALLGREMFQCYSKSISDNCCDTCRKLKTDIPGCEYGDKSMDCAEAVRRNLCSRYRAQCCKSCR